MQYKMTFGRKFFALIFATIALSALYIVTLFVAPETLNNMTLITMISTITLMCMAYIGGNVWSKYIKSKHFHSELAG